VSSQTVVPAVERILVGLDGSVESALAAEWALSLAKAVGAELIAFHAVCLLDVWPQRDDDEVHHNDHSAIQSALDGWTRPLLDRGVEVRQSLADGPPTLAILRTAAALDAQLIVVGCRGIGTTSAGALGSTSAHLVETSNIPVLVVRADGASAG